MKPESLFQTPTHLGSGSNTSVMKEPPGEIDEATEDIFAFSFLVSIPLSRILNRWAPVSFNGVDTVDFS